jgi:glycosyltransferase involved in cell wall biosynthesis
MDVTIITRRLDISMGGANGSLDLLARTLVERGNDVCVVTFKPSMNDLPADPPYEIIEPPQRLASKRITVIYRIYELLNRFDEGTDIFHLWNPVAIPGAGLYRRRGGSVPVVCRLNSYLLFCTNQDRMNADCYKNCTALAKYRHDDSSQLKRIAKLPLYLSRTTLEPRIVNNVDRFFALSPAVKEIHAENGVDPELMTVMPNFHDPNFGSNVDVTENSEPFVMMFAGRVKPAKGLDVFVDALAKMTTPFKAYIIGEGPSKKHLVDRVQSESFSGEVMFQGWLERDEVAAHLRRADVYVHPPTWPDPFPRSVLEAMQMRAVPVVSNIGGPPWAVGEAGRTFESGNAEELAEILSSLQQQPEVVSQLQNACSERIERFSKERIVPEIEKEYRTIINDRPE